MMVNGHIPSGLESRLSSESLVDTHSIIVTTKAIAESPSSPINSRRAMNHEKKKKEQDDTHILAPLQHSE